MQYFGGKHRIAEAIAKAMEPVGSHYVEPFVGGASVLCRVSAPTRFASDSNEALIAMWRALQDGWEPPCCVSEDEYAAAKELSDADPLKAFIGIGCSFAGKWFGGYARGATGRNYASGARNGLLKKIAALENVHFFPCDYTEADYRPNCTVYCDPPYSGTTQYGAVEAFDWTKFWETMNFLAERGMRVFVSEYAAPRDWFPVLEMDVKTDIRTTANGKEARREKLFVHRGSGYGR